MVTFWIPLDYKLFTYTNLGSVFWMAYKKNEKNSVVFYNST